MKKKKLLGFLPLIAILGAGASCGGESAGDILLSTTTEGITTNGVFALFTGGGGVPEAQEVKLALVTEYSPEITFTQEGATESDWLSAHGMETYDFVKDPQKYGPNWEDPSAAAADPGTVAGEEVTLGGGGAIPSK
jgi:hypothetical protein